MLKINRRNLRLRRPLRLSRIFFRRRPLINPRMIVIRLTLSRMSSRKWRKLKRMETQRILWRP